MGKSSRTVESIETGGTASRNQSLYTVGSSTNDGNSYDDSPTDSKFVSTSIRSDFYSARGDECLSADSTGETSSKESEASLSETHGDSVDSDGTMIDSRPINASATESVFRRRSPANHKGERGSGGWWTRSPRNVLPMGHRFHRFGDEEKRPSGILHDIPSEDDASVLATIEHRNEVDDKQEVPNEKANFLHQLCCSASGPEELWRNISLVTPSNSRVKDIQGRHPLHCISYNSVLMDNVIYGEHGLFETGESMNIHRSMTIDPFRVLNSSTDRLRDYVTQGLLRSYPSSMTSKDKIGRIPFEGSLIEWIEHMPLLSKGLIQGEPSLASERFASLWTKSIKRAGRRLNSGRSMQQNHIKQHPLSMRSDSKSVLRMASESTNLSHKMNDCKFRLTAASFLSFQLLSDILDYLEDNCGIDSASKRQSTHQFSPTQVCAQVSAEIVRTIASIPKLVCAVLLIDHTDQRQFAISTKIIKHVLASQHSVGPWVTEMLQSRDKRTVDRGIEYLQLVSDTVYEHEDFAGSRCNEHMAPREDVAEAISRLEGFVPSLLSLSERHVEEAATTKVVQRVLDKIMSRRFCITIVFCDALFLATQITGFRLAVNSLVVGAQPSVVLLYIYITNIGLFYFLIREMGKAASLLSITKKARVYIVSFWNVTDLLSTILTVASVISIRRGLNRDEETTDLSGIRNLLAVTTGFMWLRCLSFLKGINMQLATFILAILQIAKDVLWFCFIVLILVIAFSQMFFTVLAPDSCSYSDSTNTTNEEDSTRVCEQSEYFLRTYLLLIFQEFERDYFTTSFSVLLVVVYSFVVVLVMLNVLIAVASDSYEKCLVRSNSLFGRARVMMIAELVCFQHLLHRMPIDGDGQQGSAQLYRAWWNANWRVSRWSRASILFFGLSLLVLVAWVAAELIVVLTGPRYGVLPMSLVSIATTIVIFFGIFFFLSSEAHKQHQIRSSSGDEEQGIQHSMKAFGQRGWFQSAMLHVLLGNSGDGASTSAMADWRGRIVYLQNEMNRLSEETQLHMNEKARTLELALQQEMSDVRTEVSDIRDAMSMNHKMMQDTLIQINRSLQQFGPKA